MTNTFKNNWLDAFPPDTEFAYLYAQNLRDFRTDIQQRMAAISGLDASKPTFWQDDTTPPTGEPAKWNGLLFFATDTGKIYQFQFNSANSATPTNNWVDVTLTLVPRTIKDSTVRPVNTPTSVYTLAFPPLSATQRMRITTNYVEHSTITGGAGCVIVLIDITGNIRANIVVRGLFQAPSPGTTHTIIVEGGNVANAASQYWTWSDIGVPLATLAAPLNTTIDTSTAGYIVIAWENVSSTEQGATFYGGMLELL